MMAERESYENEVLRGGDGVDQRQRGVERRKSGGTKGICDR